VTITVIFFAALRDVVGCSEVELALSSERTAVKELIAELLSRYPALTMQGVRVALNEEFVELDAQVADGDVVALIPPVSGG
jgi:sulfur-carrier protein